VSATGDTARPAPDPVAPDLVAPDLVAPDLVALVERRRQGFGLERRFYADPDLYELELDAVWRAGWLFAGHSCELARPGDFLTYDAMGDPVVVVRQLDGSLRAVHNVCRHRGSLVVVEEAGHASRLVCPYHQWVYDLDGRLARCPGAPEGFDPSSSPLLPVAVRELAGLVFVCLAAAPPDFDGAAAELGRMAAPQGLGAASVARSIDYLVPANWKLVWENNRECFHCAVNHPQYVRANFDRFAPGEDARVDELAAALERTLAELAGSEVLGELHSELGLAAFPDGSGRRWWSANRTALQEGFVTESVDGRRVAPLMGSYRREDVGTLRLRTLPNFWCHASCDHAVTTRLTPAGPEATRVRVSWLVAGSAVEGHDYTTERLLPFWQLTSEQDWTICERQQRGVMSRAFVPGPLSPTKEANVERFLAWYVGRLATALGLPGPGAPEPGPRTRSPAAARS